MPLSATNAPSVLSRKFLTAIPAKKLVDVVMVKGSNGSKASAVAEALAALDVGEAPKAAQRAPG